MLPTAEARRSASPHGCETPVAPWWPSPMWQSSFRPHPTLEGADHAVEEDVDGRDPDDRRVGSDHVEAKVPIGDDSPEAADIDQILDRDDVDQRIDQRQAEAGEDARRCGREHN